MCYLKSFVIGIDLIFSQVLHFNIYIVCTLFSVNKSGEFANRNALDAEATAIEVKLMDYGLSAISVSIRVLLCCEL
jgi:hypothetical protein